jgi:hypothetical protein
MKRILIVAFAALLVGCGARAAQRPPSAGDELIRAMFDTAVDGAQRGDAQMVLVSLEPAMRDDIYKQLSEPKQYQVASLYGQAALNQGDGEAAHRAFVLATSHDEAGPADWNGRMHSAISSGDGTDAYLAFKRLRDSNFPVLESFDNKQVDRLDQLLRALPDSAKARMVLGREMEREHWVPPLDGPDKLWLHYTEALLEAGDTRKAAIVAGRITDPMILMAMRADSRFDAIIAANPSLQDPEATAERRLASAQDYARQHPTRLMAKVEVAEALALLNREPEALPLLEDANHSIATAPRTRPPFEDMESNFAVEAWRTSLLISLGRVDEGVASRVATAFCCAPVLITPIARPLMEANRPKEAQRWLVDASAAGLGLHERMELAQVKACVAAQLGDAAQLEQQLQYLTANEAWKPEAVVEALVCADRLDAAAAALARQLKDPRTRLAALSRLQVYAPEPDALPYSVLLDKRWAQLRSMPAVRSEVAKVGRIRTYRLNQWQSVS